MMILERMKQLLGDGSVPAPTRLELWHIFAKAHASANQCRGRGHDDFNNTVRQELLDNLTWARSVLVSRPTGLEELTAAREVWKWHASYDKDPLLKAASSDLESLYVSNDLAGEFEPLLGSTEWEKRSERAAEKAAQLAAAKVPEELDDFVDRAVHFLGDGHRIYELSEVAGGLGKSAPKSDAIQSFVRAALAASGSQPKATFAIRVAAGWSTALRAEGSQDKAYELAYNLTGDCGSNELKIDLIHYLYGTPPRRDLGKMSVGEHDYLRSLASLFLGSQRGPEFIDATGWTVCHDWAGFKTVIEGALDRIPSHQLPNAVNFLVNGVYWAVRDGETAEIPDGLGIWLLDQVLRIPDLADPGDTLRWHVAEILKRIGRAPLDWLPKALARRRSMEAEGIGSAYALSRSDRLSRFVTPISPVQQGEPAVVEAIAELMDLMSETGTVGYYLPGILADVDPEGLVIPGQVASRIETANDRDCRRLASIASGYALGGPAWRKIAKPVIARALTSSDPRPFFRCLLNSEKSWCGTPGEVPAIFVTTVQTARERLEAETDATLRPFWEWHLVLAEAELRQQQDEAKEERGE